MVGHAESYLRAAFSKGPVVTCSMKTS